MTICAFIVTYNRLDLLKKCYAALANQTKPVDELVIINNDSTDGTNEWLSTLTNVTIINQDNIGGAGGFRRGFEYAFEKGYEWVMPFDDDCEPSLDYIEKAQSYLSDDNIHICTGQYYDHGKRLFFRSSKKGVWDEGGLITNGKTLSTQDAGFPFLFVRRTIFESVGFHYLFWFIYLDDTEWVKRIIDKGFTIHVLPIDAGHHYSGRESKILDLGFFKKEIQIYGEWKTYYFFRNGIVFKRISGVPLVKIILINTAKFLLIFLQSRPHQSRFKAAFRGISDGLRMDIKNLK